MRYGSRLRVHLPRLEHNFQALRRICPHKDILFMVKANAYGHGLHPIASFAHGDMGVSEFGCATLGEALGLRQGLDGEFEVYVLSDVYKGLRERPELFAEHRLLPVISSMEDLDVFLAAPELSGCPLCLKVNTGMNRLGISYKSLEKLCEKLQKASRKSIAHLMTHYACASSPMDSPLNREQTENFEQVKSFLRDSGIALEKTSSACSGAIEQGEGLEESHIRPGLMLYGPASTGSCDFWQGKIISDLESLVISVRQISAGEPVGYGGASSPRKGTLAVVPLGYGDGLGNAYRGAKLWHKGKPGEVFGRVNMDMIQVLFGPSADIAPGEGFTVWNEDPEHLSALSRSSGLSPYELFCQISQRVPREYR